MNIESVPITIQSWVSELQQLQKEFSNADSIYKIRSQICDLNYKNLSEFKKKYEISTEVIARQFSSILNFPVCLIRNEGFPDLYKQTLELVKQPKLHPFISTNIIEMSKIISEERDRIDFKGSYPEFFDELKHQKRIKFLTKQADDDHYKLVSIISSRNELIKKIADKIAPLLIIHSLQYVKKAPK